MGAYGLQTHIWSNNTKTALLLAGFPVLLVLLTYGLFLLYAGLAGETLGKVGEIEGAFIWAADALARSWPYALVGAGLWFAIAYAFYQVIIDAATGARKVERKDEPRLYNLLENLCISRGMKTPALRIMDTDALNAFATGLHEGQYSVTVTRGLMQTLNDEELEAVLAHELTHIRNGDVRILVIAVVMAGIISFVGELTFRFMFRSRPSGGTTWRSSSSGNRKGGGGAIAAILIALALIALAWILSIVIRFSLSRSREYLADAGAVELTKNPDAMIMALRKIENRGELRTATSSVMEMCFDNPHSGFADLFSTHPAIEKRIDALVRTAGGSDPGPLALPEPGSFEPGNTGAVERAAPGPWERPAPEMPGEGKPNPWRS